MTESEYALKQSYLSQLAHDAFLDGDDELARRVAREKEELSDAFYAPVAAKLKAAMQQRKAEMEQEAA